MAPPDGGGTGRHPIRVGAACGRPRANTVRPYNIYGQSGGASGMPRPTRWAAAAIYGGPTRLCRHLSVGPRYIATAHTCAEVWRRCGAPAEAQRSTRKGYAVSVRRQSRQRLRSGFGGERSRSGRNELCRLRQSERSGACGDAVTLRVGRMAGALSLGSAKNAAPGCARRLFFRLRPVLAPLCAYPPRFFAVTLRLFATPGFPPAPGTNSQFANWPGLYPSLRSIRAAHGGSALLFRQFPQKFFRKLLKRAKRTGIIERQCM